jgi:serralysin
MAEFSVFGAAGVDMRNIDFHLIYGADLAESGPGDYESEWLNFVDTVSYPEIAYELRGWFVYSVDELTLDVDFLSSSYVSFIRASWMETDDDLDFIEGLYEIKGFELNYTYFDGSMTSESVAEIIFQYSDRIDGSSGSDYLMGYGGRDTLFGDGGNDTLNGGSGSDVMLGDTGDDVYIVDSYRDVAWEYENDGLDTVKSSVSYELSNNVERLILTGIEDVDATGNALANSLVGNVANNVLDGKSGADTMSGGKGNDTYVLDNAGDVVIEAAGGGTDLVKSSVSWTMGANVDKVALIGSANISAAGNTLNNTMLGNTGNNSLNGGAGNDAIGGGNGNDKLYGGLGNDMLTGGAGKDTFVFHTALNASTNIDKITDFSRADDVMQIDNALFLGLAAGQLASSMFKDVTLGPKDASDRILYNSDTGSLFFDRDGSGSTYAAVKFATLSGTPTLTAADFFVI